MHTWTYEVYQGLEFAKIKDPGSGGTVKMNNHGVATCGFISAGAEARTVNGPSRVGQELTLYLDTDGGNVTVTVKDSGGNTTYTHSLNDAGDVLLYRSLKTGSTLVWSLIASTGGFGATTGTREVPLTSFRVHDALQTNLPGTAANDDMAIITGTPGTDAPTLQGVDFGGTTTDEAAACELVIPEDYAPGGTLTLRVRAAMLTTVSDGTATVDVNVWKPDGDGAVGSDLCATAAQSINSLTLANKDFTITPTGLVAGDKLMVKLSFAGSDTGNVGVMIPEIQSVTLLYDKAL